MQDCTGPEGARGCRAPAEALDYRPLEEGPVCRMREGARSCRTWQGGPGCCTTAEA